MKGKILFVAGLGLGYVLGTRAGRERYEQIRRAAENVWNQPTVQDGVNTVKDFTMSRVGDLGENVLDGAKTLIRKATNGGSGSGSTAKSGSGSKTDAAKLADALADGPEDAIDSAADAATTTTRSPRAKTTRSRRATSTGVGSGASDDAASFTS